MGKNSGLQVRNEEFITEFVEMWQTGTVDPLIWRIAGTGSVTPQVANGHMTMAVEGLNGSDVTLGTLLGFPCAPDGGFVFASDLDQDQSFIKKLTVEFMADITLVNVGGVIVDIGLNDANDAPAGPGNEALLFRFEEPGVIRRVINRVAGADQPIDVTLASNRFKIEITRHMVRFFNGNVLLHTFTPITGVPVDFMYFWIRCLTTGAGDQALARMYPITVRYEMI